MRKNTEMIDDEEDRIADAFEAVCLELRSAMREFPPFRSAHEGVALVEEEFIELRDAAYWPHKEDTGDEVVEATQLAAMSIRYLIDVCYKEDVPR
jgi:hypothetical protein